MKYFKLLFILALLNFYTVFSQEKLIKHTVKKGETITVIAQKYQVAPAAIYELNPDCSRVLKLESIILIPRSTSKGLKVKLDSKITSIENTHEVQPKETLFGIAKQYEISVDELNNVNPELAATGLKAGQIIKIPTKINSITSSIPKKDTAKFESIKEVVQKEKQEKSIPTPFVTRTEITTHEVMPSETLFGIAKQYEISVDELNNENPELAATVLKAGQKIKIPVKFNFITNSTPKKETSKIESKKEVVQKEKLEKSISTPDATLTATTIYEVMPSETKFGIAKQYGISVTDLDKANPILENGSLKAGQKIVIPVKEGIEVKPLVKQVEEVQSSKKIALKEKAKEEIVIVNKEAIEEKKTTITHEVLAKETKYGIAKKYGISVSELETQNPSIAKNLYVGAKLIISGAKTNQEDVIITTLNKENSESKENKENLTIASSLAKWSTNEELANELIRMASDNLGASYRSGGITKNGFDCSGLMYATFSSLDIKLPRSSHEMASIGTVIDINQAQKGDLIFFKTRGGNQINHVGMVVEVCDGEIRFIHSATHGGVIISSTKEKYYEKNFTQINRVLQ